MKIALIPARGGSKRIPKKNIKNFFGKPMIQWSIEACIKAQLFDRIIVSTDDGEIAEVAKRCGAEVPFIRPDNIADDYSTTTAVVSHAIAWLQDSGVKLDLCCCIYATAPFINPQDIRSGYELISTTDADYVFSITGFDYPIQRAIRLDSKKYISMVDASFYEKRSQDLEPFFHDAGQFYWGRPRSWLEERPIFLSKSLPVIIPKDRVQDIDDLEDWHRAELMFEALLKSK
jgi:N-acylneuraminate cytidylyltransferase